MADCSLRVGAVMAMVSTLTCSSCSLLFTTKPPPNAANLPPKASVACTSSRAAPLVDSGVAMGLTFQSINLLRKDNNAATPLISTGADIAILGTIVVAYAVSAVYGYQVTQGCHDLKRGHVSAPSTPGAFPAQDDEDKRMSRSRRPTPSREPEPAPPTFETTTWEAPLSLPKVIGGFAFSTSPAEAEKICAASGRKRELEGESASCSLKGEDGDELVKLEFGPGGVVRIVMVHAPDEDAFNRSYDTLHAKLKARYGKPQVWRTTAKGDCATRMPECMKRGEAFTGTKWVLPLGSVELAPVWRDGQAFVEERYAGAPPPTH